MLGGALVLGSAYFAIDTYQLFTTNEIEDYGMLGYGMVLIGLPSNDLTKSLRCCSKTGGRIQEKLFDWLAKTGTALQQTLLPSELCALFMKSVSLA